MGWFFGENSRKSLIRSLVKTYQPVHAGGQPWVICDEPVEVVTLKHCWRGGRFHGILWSVKERRLAGQALCRWIECNLVRCDKGDWGYKRMAECDGPYFYSCPLGYLAMVTEENGKSEINEGWRVGVRRWHVERQGLRAARKQQKNSLHSLGGLAYHTQPSVN